MKEINVNDVYKKVLAGQTVSELESDVIGTPIVPDSIFDKIIKKDGTEFKRWINVNRMIEFLEETGRNAQNSEAPIESKPIAHTKFYGQFVGLIQEISKNCNQLSECFELSGGYVQINGVNYPISLRNKEQIEKLVSALYVIKNNAIPMNVEKKKQFGRSYSSYYYNTDEQIIDAEAEAKREETNMVRLAGR